MIGQYNIDSTTYHYNHIINPQHSSDFPKAITYYTGLKEKHLRDKNTYGAIEDLRMIAIAEFEMGNNFESETAFVDALELIDNSPFADTLVDAKKGLYNQLGRIYRATHRFEECIDAYGNALRFSANQNDSLTLLNNIGNVYMDMGRYKKALEQFDLALIKGGVKENTVSFARLLNNKGVALAKTGESAAALANMQQALALRESKNDMAGKYSSYKSLALYYFDQNDTKQALDYANKAYAVANTMNGLSYLEDALSVFVTMSPDPKIVQFEKITDSIATEKQLAENKNAFMKYNVEKERKNTVAAQLEKEKQKTWTILLLALASVGFVVAVVLYLTIKYKHKQEKVQQVQTTEKRISKKVHDEVANDVYRLMAKLQSKPVGKDEILDDLESIYNKSRDISKENSVVAVENFQEVLSDLLLGYENQQVSVIRRDVGIIDWSTVSDIKKTNLYRVLQELMTNMAKHSNATAVVLNFDQKGKTIAIKYADNGKGCTIKCKNGLQNAESRIAAINGTITFESEPNKGFKATIII
ncbi:tetratricopeptide repeat protein,histidine kinase [Aequorivita sublithincola DSM 14238]|uniref:histidine kinase n=1 Tax=Aequorivita sublithincola (strain DSM 14238 / LMG 21431 / ACAM 643 / 9-3) TaxID=746697 RepID=I3YVW1_AEQSU|nr:tetratricopeptide repeat-containing sensor histidine kinase [Aequorivita sublithincola]AFL81129.1 tetratricopeptide repeat protein,histidine kinase [Aequorivita sublithincola DSM 14238]